MSSNLYDIPSVKDELNRKTIETLERLDHQFNTGQITEHDFIVALDTINSIGLGLIDSDISTFISNHLAENRDSVAQDRASLFLVSPNKMLYQHLSESTLSLTTFQITSDTPFKVTRVVESFDDSNDPAAAACGRFEDLQVKLKNRFTEFSTIKGSLN